MASPLAVTPDEIAYAIAGGVLVLFAAFLLYLSPHHRASRALAALLTSMSTVWAMDLLAELAPPAMQTVLLSLVATALTAIGVSAVYFLCVYPRPRGWIGRSPAAGWVATGVVVASAALFFTRPDLFVVTTTGPDGPEFADNGPLVLVINLWTITTSAMLVLFAIDATRTPPGPIRRALLLVLAAFLAGGIVWPLSLLLNDVTGRLAPTAIDASFSRLAYVIDEVSVFMSLAAAALIVTHGLRSTDATIRRDARLFSVLVMVAVALTLVATFAFPPPGAEDWTNVGQGVADALAGMAIAAFAGYALLKHRLFDIDVKLRWTISRGTVAVVFVGIFFVASQVAQSFFEDSLGWALGGVITGVMLFAIAPIQRMAERVAVSAVPVHEATPADRRVELYRLALALALTDRVITREEERHLARLAEELGIGHTEALEAREAMEREMGVAP